MRVRSRVRRSGDGTFELRIPADERDLLRSVGPSLREILVDRATSIEPGEDEAVDRLFPAAYPDDEERQAEFRLLAHDQLLESHLGALAVLEETVDADRLDEDQLLAWMRAINHVRLVLGVRLEITEDRDDWPRSRRDPRAPAFAVYDYLTYLQGEIIEALSAT
ncbi:MAG TPA: DUF2017 family protein [Acidimicrobiales bacterium]|nr:DUF2017 family protein [Acidimicrobiales bacterium]